MQREFGKCERTWMKENSFCSRTCGHCSCDEGNAGASVASEPDAGENCGNCVDIPPSEGLSCEEQVGSCLLSLVLMHSGVCPALLREVRTKLIHLSSQNSSQTIVMDSQSLDFELLTERSAAQMVDAYFSSLV